MDVENIVPSHIVTDLANGFKEWKPLDITPRATDLHDHNFCLRFFG